LAPLKRQRKIEEWYDRQIEPGTAWEHAISSRLEDAHLILLLMSADFLASDYCFGVEMETAMARLKSGEAKVVPILVSPCQWTGGTGDHDDAGLALGTFNPSCGFHWRGKAALHRDFADHAPVNSKSRTSLRQIRAHSYRRDLGRKHSNEQNSSCPWS